MPKEAPFISRALKLVSIVILVTTISIAATAAYSGYEEYGALTASMGAAGSGRFVLGLNGSNLEISGLSVPNRMTFPLTLELAGNISLDNATVGVFDSGAYVIQPNQSKSISLSIPLSFDGLLKDKNALRQAVVNSSDLSITTVLSAHMVPLLGINITNSANSTEGPILGDLTASLNASAEQLTDGGQTISIPLVLSWQNTSPLIEGALWVQANLTQVPGKSSGNYGSTSGILNFTEGQNEQSFELQVPISDIGGNTLRVGTYYFIIYLSQSQASQPFTQIQTSASV